MVRKLLGLPEASYSPDGEMVKFTLSTATERIELTASAQTALSVASRMSKVAVQALDVLHKTKGHTTVTAEEVVGLEVGAPVGDPVVILSLRGTNGIVQTFAIPPDIAETLLKGLARAEPVARANLKKTIQ